MPTIDMPAPDTEVKFVDVDSDEEIPIEETIPEEREGEVLPNGPQRIESYLNESKTPSTTGASSRPVMW